MDKKQHNKANSQNSWIDPFYLNELLTEEELSIQKTTQNYYLMLLSIIKNVFSIKRFIKNGVL